jgi:two-component system, OmpR family, sensor histidine kinase MprB
MSFRRRMILLAAGAVAAAVLLASAVVYVVTRDELLGQIDLSLRQKPQSVQFQAAPGVVSLARLKVAGRLPPGATAQVGVELGSGQQAGGSASLTAPAPATKRRGSQSLTIERTRLAGPGGLIPAGLSGIAKGAKLVLPPQKLGGATGYVQLYQSNGPLVHSETRGSPGSLLPVTAATREVAAGRRAAFFSDVTIAGTPVRMLTEQAAPGGVWQVALPLSDFNSTLSRLRLVLALVSLGGIALAAALGLLVSRAALVPVRRLTGAAERVARTQDLGHRIEAGRDDDLGRLADSFNTMLAALERSRLAQRQLVSDASHELRTPLTSVQANLDALVIGDRLSGQDRARVVAAAQAQLSELTVLVGDLVDLSKTEVEEVEIEDVRLDLAAAAAVQRARLHAPRCRFSLDAEPCLVRAAPARLDRAIANLLDNACQWSPSSPDADPIEVCVRNGSLSVRDHGPGIANEDLPRVFDRFYRAASARARPGSGLGLAIVRHLAESHGGAVHAANDPRGGARLTIELPALPMTDAELACSEPGVRAGAPVHQAPRLL